MIAVARARLYSSGQIIHFCARVLRGVFSGRVLYFLGETLRQAGILDVG